MLEIERKFRLTSAQKTAVEQKLRATYDLLEPKRQIDEVFLYGIDSFNDFVQGMSVARLRTENDITQLAYKRRINDGGDMVEHELTVSSADAMRHILDEMNYRLVTSVDKTRLEAHDNEVTFALDIVKNLGDFLEIEVIAKDDRGLANTEQRIMAIAADFGLTPEDIETKKYDQLMAGKR